MKKLLLMVSLITGTAVALAGCGDSTTVESYEDKPAIHFDAGYIISSVSDNLMQILGLTVDTTDVVEVSAAVNDLQSMKTNNDTYLAELEGLQHDDPAAEEYKNLVVEYLQEQNLYIEGTIENLYSGNTNLPDETYMRELGTSANEQLSEFRYEEK